MIKLYKYQVVIQIVPNIMYYILYYKKSIHVNKYFRYYVPR